MPLKSMLLGLAGTLSAVVLFAAPAVTPQASAGGTISLLSFSTSVNDKWEPTGRVGINFSENNDGIFATFSFQDLSPGSRVSRIVRLNGEDYNWDGPEFGSLNCCPDGGSGRYGFRILKPNARRGELPGGAYEARIYLDGNDAQGGGFGVKGTGGGD